MVKLGDEGSGALSLEEFSVGVSGCSSDLVVDVLGRTRTKAPIPGLYHRRKVDATAFCG